MKYLNHKYSFFNRNFFKHVAAENTSLDHSSVCPELMHISLFFSLVLTCTGSTHIVSPTTLLDALKAMNKPDEEPTS